MKRDLLRKIVGILLVLTMAAALVSCKGGDKKDDGSNKTTSTPVPTEEPAVTAAPETTPEPADSITAEPTPEPVTDTTPAPDPEDAGQSGNHAQAGDTLPASNISLFIDRNYNYEWNEDTRECYGHYNYDIPGLYTEDAARYPGLNAVFEDYAGNIRDDVKTVMDDIIEAACADETYDMYFKEVSLTATRADSELVCLLTDYEVYTGGVHGMYGSYGLCYDPKSGNELMLSDIVSDKAAFIDYVYDSVIAESDMLFEPENLREKLEKDFDEGTLYFEVGYNYLSVIFNPYDIEPYVAGQRFVDIPFAGNENMFNSRYLKAPGDYMVSIGNGYRFRSDILGDGVVDRINIYRDYCDEYDNFDALTFYINDQPVPKSFDIGDRCYDLETTYVHANGKDYIYITFWYDSDDTKTKVYSIDFNPDGYDPLAEDNPYGTVNEVGTIWKGLYGKITLNPMNMVLEEREDVIGTCFVTNRYYVGEDGLPVAEDDIYDFSSWNRLTTRKEITMKKVSQETRQVIEDYVVPEGTNLLMYYTDCASYVDFEITGDDDTLLRMDIIKEIKGEGDWEYYMYYPVGAESFDELFSGISYAD